MICRWVLAVPLRKAAGAVRVSPGDPSCCFQMAGLPFPPIQVTLYQCQQHQKLPVTEQASRARHLRILEEGHPKLGRGPPAQRSCAGAAFRGSWLSATTWHLGNIKITAP